MRLKRVKIFGFKTFADRTEFDVHSNLIAVVGPNGCGKSNLVDAILWGLGEGNARQLRAQSSQDVIFSGSARRKSVGFAEVSLLFDNEDGTLPLASSEVSITRRLNRSGASDYFINRQACRLRDVFDLLSDTGLGRAGYAIVGQKEIDQALMASAEDRRAWLDEAAGVQRYRARKLESLKRLASAQTHLSRVCDILSEINLQREPLRAEAELAVRYKSILESLREVESAQLILEVAKGVRESKELQMRIDSDLALACTENDHADGFEGESRRLGEEARAVERELSQLLDARQASSTAIERKEAAISLGEHKLQSLNDLEQNLGGEAEEANRRIALAESDLRVLKDEASAERDNLTAIATECSGAGEEAETLRAELEAIEAQLLEAKRLHELKLKREAEANQVLERKNAARRELKGIDESLPALESALADAQSSCDAAVDGLKDAELEVAKLSDALSEHDAEVSIAYAENRDRLSALAALEGRKLGIEGTLLAHEGLNQGARAVLEAHQAGRLLAAYLPVAEAIEVERRYATAIESALGEAVNDLIVSSEQDAMLAIAHLAENGLGRATFRPMPSGSIEHGDHKAEENGLIGCAADLVQCQEENRAVIKGLLGSVFVVANLDVARKLSRRNAWKSIVTLEGEVLHADGAITGGQWGGGSRSLLQRRSELTQVGGEINGITQQVAQFESESLVRDGLRAKLEEGLETGRARAKEHLAAVSEARHWLNQVQAERVSTERSRERLVRELTVLEAHQPEPIEDTCLPEMESSRDKAIAALAARSADAAVGALRLKEAEQRLQQANFRVEAAERRLQAARDNEVLRLQKMGNLGPEREKLTLEISAILLDLEGHRTAKVKADSSIELLQAKRAKVFEQAELATQSARAARASAQAALEKSHESEIARARTEARRAVFVQRLSDEYSMTESEAVSKSDSTEVPRDAAALVSRLRREANAMGEVNLGAVEAYERLTSRSEVLETQKEDVEGGIREVQASIGELDKLTRDRFLATFREVQASFSSIFTRLFEGGEGRVTLTDENNLLESGIEIEVVLPGKKRQKPELLSGGERSLCAASFLFALLKVRPSPLVILDEVDAPLDGRNVERFLEVVHEFATASQFILITHNPTTIESAPVWVGVTMQEPGVSTIVPARFAPAEAVILN